LCERNERKKNGLHTYWQKFFLIFNFFRRFHIFFYCNPRMNDVFDFLPKSGFGVIVAVSFLWI